MNEISQTNTSWRILRRILIGLAIFFTLVAAFYTEEDWRGKRAWEQCKRELEAKGVVLDWAAYIPPPVPDAQNFFNAPRMQEWFEGRGSSELSKRLENPKTVPVGDDEKIKTKADAREYLAWSDQFEPDFILIREALNRPYARMVGDYTLPYASPIPNFITVRIFAQTLAQRAHCYFLLGEPQKALEELTFLNDSRRLLEGAPTGKPMTLVAAMINVAVTGLYIEMIAEGCQRRVWQERQLAELQRQLEQINLPAIVALAFESEPAATTHTLEMLPKLKLRDWFSLFGNRNWWETLEWALFPRGWIYQNMATGARLICEQAEGFDSAHGIIQPETFRKLPREMKTIARPYKLLAVVAVPNFTKAWQTTAHNQAMAHEAQFACALERYYLTHGEYPETLDALVPQFMTKMPHDIIGGQPLHYRRTNDGKFLLYSIGWNETDDGGVNLSKEHTGSTDYSNGDWVWQYPAK